MQIYRRLAFFPEISRTLVTMDENGSVFVLATDEFKILGNYALGDGGTARSSVVLTHGLVVVRTAEKLLVFGSK